MYWASTLETPPLTKDRQKCYAKKKGNVYSKPSHAQAQSESGHDGQIWGFHTANGQILWIPTRNSLQMGAQSALPFCARDTNPNFRPQDPSQSNITRQGRQDSLLEKENQKMRGGHQRVFAKRRYLCLPQDHQKNLAERRPRQTQEPLEKMAQLP